MKQLAGCFKTIGTAIFVINAVVTLICQVMFQLMFYSLLDKAGILSSTYWIYLVLTILVTLFGWVSLVGSIVTLMAGQNLENKAEEK